MGRADGAMTGESGGLRLCAYCGAHLPRDRPSAALAAGGHLIEVCRDCWLLREIARLLPLVRAWGEHALIVEALTEVYRLVRACSVDAP